MELTCAQLCCLERQLLSHVFSLGRVLLDPDNLKTIQNAAIEISKFKERKQALDTLLLQSAQGDGGLSKYDTGLNLMSATKAAVFMEPMRIEMLLAAAHAEPEPLLSHCVACNTNGMENQLVRSSPVRLAPLPSQTPPF